MAQIELKRKVYQNMVDWAQAKSKKALLVVGARQIGKSYLIHKLGREEFSQTATINLYENKEAKKAFANVGNVQDFFSVVSLFSRTQLIKNETLIFIDEIQECPDLLTLIKFLVEDGRYAYAFSGSMLGTELKHIRSYPVGFVHEITMYPLDFEEFCAANSVTKATLLEIQSRLRALEQIPAAHHKAFLDLFRNYVIVGGMPEAVTTFLASKGNIAQVRSLQKDLVSAYLADITKYASREAPQIRAIFEQLPLQLDTRSVRFKLNSLKEGARYNTYAPDFQWLVSAGTAWKCNVVQNPVSPLKASEKPSSFKLYESDTGMLCSRYPLSLTKAIYLDNKDVNYGFLFENVFAQLLAAQGAPLFYYLNKKRGEVDFLVESKTLGILPVEIKSGRAARLHAALTGLVENNAYSIECGVVFSRLNVEKDGKILYYPWYAAAFLQELLGLQEEDSEPFIIKPGLSL